MTPELKPCPFCGKPAYLSTWGWATAKCGSCNLSIEHPQRMNGSMAEREVVERWNTRPLESQARAEALEEAAKCLPDTWLDPLLTGPSATIPHDCPSTERFVRALQARIRALKEQPPEGER